MKKKKRKRSRYRRKRIILAVSTLVFICLVLTGILLVVVNMGDDERICDGVQIGSIDVGGLTQEEAQEKVADYILNREGKQITVHVGEQQVNTVARDLGLSYPEENYAEEAWNVGKQGNFLKRFQEKQRAASGHITYDLEPELNEDSLRSFVETECAAYDVKAKDSKLKLKDGKVTATKSRVGQEIQVEETVQLIREAVLSEEEGSGEVTAVIVQTEPEYTQEEIAQCTDLLGRYSTTYSTYQVARSSNVALAAGRINGTVLYPGETFSTVEVILDRTEENGYQSAPEYSSGKVIDGIGGGVCQVSTTLYNAVINAELEVVERSPHSMVVAYVDVSRDAAISGDYKDFKFQNNLDYPVYIMGSASGGVLTFQIYGQETRPENREISFESEITATIEPGQEVVTEDPSLPASYRTVTQSAHVGYRANLWKIVKVDGVQTDKILLNSSSYNASPQYVTVGKQNATPTPAPSDGKAGNGKNNTDSKTDKNKPTTKPEATAKPTAKPKPTEKPSGGQSTTEEDAGEE